MSRRVPLKPLPKRKTHVAEPHMPGVKLCSGGYFVHVAETCAPGDFPSCRYCEAAILRYKTEPWYSLLTRESEL